MGQVYLLDPYFKSLLLGNASSSQTLVSGTRRFLSRDEPNFCLPALQLQRYLRSSFKHKKLGKPSLEGNNPLTPAHPSVVSSTPPHEERVVITRVLGEFFRNSSPLSFLRASCIRLLVSLRSETMSTQLGVYIFKLNDADVSIPRQASISSFV